MGARHPNHLALSQFRSPQGSKADDRDDTCGAMAGQLAPIKAIGADNICY